MGRRETYTVSNEWLTHRVAKGEKAARAKLVLTSDAFNTPSAQQPLVGVLREMLNHRDGLTALWIHDARAGWHDVAVGRGWLMDGFDELEWLCKCGCTTSSGLWINRWCEEGPAPMQLAPNLLRSHHQHYVPVEIDEVKQAIDRASVLYLPGGNPYTLLDALRSKMGSEVWGHAQARIATGELVLLTRSAGTIITGATVDVSTERPPDWSGDPTGLQLAPANLTFIPHYHLPHIDRLEHAKEWR